MNPTTEPHKKSRKRNVWYSILTLLLIFLLPYIYFTFFHVPSRVYTRENTGLERLPPDVEIPMMPDGSRVDYIKAYELIYLRLCEKPEENGWREIVSYMGPAVFMWNVPSKDSPPMVGRFIPISEMEERTPPKSPPTDEEWKQRMAEFERDFRPGWEEYCRKLALAPESLSVNKKVTDPEIVEDAICWRLEEKNADEYEFRKIVSRKLRVTGWNTAEYPEMAVWVAAHEELLDLAAGAVRQERYILPFFRKDENTYLLATFSDSGDWRFQWTLAVGFCARATMRLRMEDADAEKIFADVESLWRLARHLRLMPQFLINSVGMTIESLAKELTVRILEENLWNSKQLKTLASLLDSLPAPVSQAEIADVNHWTIYEYIDAPSLGESEPDKSLRYLDMGVVAERYTELRKGEAAEGAEEHVENIAKSPVRRFFTALSVRECSKVYADMLASLSLPQISNVNLIAGRTECFYQLTRLTVFLKCYHSQHGAYPETLDALVPEYFAQVPVILGVTRPLTYARRGDGFLLAAVRPEFDPEKELTKEEEEEYEDERLFVVKMPD